LTGTSGIARGGRCFEFADGCRVRIETPLGNATASDTFTAEFGPGSLTIVANPAEPGWHFISWTNGPCAGSTNPTRTFEVPTLDYDIRGLFTR
jgi:hypothetical protein